MKSILLPFLTILFSSSIAHALTPKNLKCSKNGTGVIYINGVRVPEPEARKDLDKIENLTFKDNLNNEKLLSGFLDKKETPKYELSYNTNMSSLLDLMEAGAQKLQLEKRLSRDRAWQIIYTAISAGDFSVIPFTSWGLTMDDISNSSLPAIEELIKKETADTNLLKSKIEKYLVDDKKVIIISHGQGNLFTNSAYNELQADNPLYVFNNKRFLDYDGLFRNLQVATPANDVLMPGTHVTNNFDIILKAPKSLKGNIGFPFPDIFSEPRSALERQLNHSLTETYLNENIIFANVKNKVMQELIDNAETLESNCQNQTLDGTYTTIPSSSPPNKDWGFASTVTPSPALPFQDLLFPSDIDNKNNLLYELTTKLNTFRPIIVTYNSLTGSYLKHLDLPSNFYLAAIAEPICDGCYFLENVFVGKDQKLKATAKSRPINGLFTQNYLIHFKYKNNLDDECLPRETGCNLTSDYTTTEVNAATDGASLYAFNGSSLAYNTPLDLLVFGGVEMEPVPNTGTNPLIDFDVNEDGYWDQRIYVFRSEGSFMAALDRPQTRYSFFDFLSNNLLVTYLIYPTIAQSSTGLDHYLLTYDFHQDQDGNYVPTRKAFKNIMETPELRAFNPDYMMPVNVKYGDIVLMRATSGATRRYFAFNPETFELLYYTKAESIFNPPILQLFKNSEGNYIGFSSMSNYLIKANFGEVIFPEGSNTGSNLP